MPKHIIDPTQYRLRQKNKALLIALVIMIVMLYTLAMVRLKGSF